MGSTNGLIVNGQKLERASLDEGDLLTLGPDAVLRLSYRTPDELGRAGAPGRVRARARAVDRGNLWRLRYAGYIMRASPPSTKLIDVKLERLVFDLPKCLT
jgi:hypothetical protein